MIFQATPTEFEIYEDGSKDLAAKVTMFDGSAATIEIRTCVNRTSFDKLVPAIQFALSAMNLEKP